MKAVVLINGVPASGKSRVARALSDETGWPVLTLDVVKEALFDHVGAGERDYNRKLGKASFAAIFSLIADWPDGTTALVDAWYGFQPEAFVLPTIARCGATSIAEVWCHAPPEVIADRYRARIGQRAAQHPGEEYIPELIALAGRAKPLGHFPLVSLDTCAVLSPAALAKEIRAKLAQPSR